ncbi:MAG: c-type cytochrome [Propionivibrio sp.]
MKPPLILATTGLMAALLGAPVAQAADAEAAEALAKKEGCLKCHAVDKKKDAISLKDVAKKYAGKPDGEAKILAQITTGQKVKLEDGTEEEHKVIKTKDKAEVTNMIQWILSLK